MLHNKIGFNPKSLEDTASDGNYEQRGLGPLQFHLTPHL